jgi:hypothetical protein
VQSVSIRLALPRWRWVAAIAVCATLLITAIAYAYSEHYGGNTVSGGGGYIESGGAHTFVENQGSSVGFATYLACQLRNSTINDVGHGYGTCKTNDYTGQYVWARVYDESQFSDTLYGYAFTP